MVIFLFFIGVSQAFTQPLLLEYAEKVSTPLQDKCFKIFAGDLLGSEIRQAVVCGKKITTASTLSTLRTWGLLHLAVVSGSHLIFLLQLLNILKTPLFIRHLLLATFVFTSGFDPPVVKSWLQLLLERSRLRHLYIWSPLLCLALFPSWFNSVSFWLSALASSCLYFPLPQSIKDHPVKSLLIHQSLFYLTFTPLSFSFGSQHPISILSNLIFAQLLGFIWIPLSLHPASEHIYSYFIDSAQKITLNLSALEWNIHPLWLIVPIYLAFSLLIYSKKLKGSRCKLYV